MKVNNKNRIITDDDILVTNTHNLGDSLKDVLDEQRNDIEKLKGNMKFIYAYGGIGGNGSGGSGSGSSTKDPELYAELTNTTTGDSFKINLTDDNPTPLILGKSGIYKFYAKLRYSNGDNFYLKMAYGTNSISTSKRNLLSTEENNCEFEQEITLNSNGTIKVYLQSDDDVLYNVSQKYIVTVHDFGTSFMYESNGVYTEFDDSNEYFLGSSSQKPFINTDFTISLPNVSDISITYTIGDFFTKTVSDLSSSGNDKLYLQDVKKDGEAFLQDKNSGVYVVKVDFKYTSLDYGIMTDSASFNISIIPSYLFVSLTSTPDILYDTIEELEQEIKDATVPTKYINPGAYMTVYSKVYDGPVKGSYKTYTISCLGYEQTADGSDTDSEPDWLKVDSACGTDAVTEQKISTKGISLNFSTPGIKKIVLSTSSPKASGGSVEITKYLYVKELDDLIAWPSASLDYYFKGNEIVKYSTNINGIYTFPEVTENSLIELTFTDSPLTLSDSAWTDNVGTSTDVTTLLSFGIQMSEINTEHSQILEVTNDGDNTLFKMFTDTLFAGETSDICKILIPSEEYDETDGSKFHLVQIARQKMEQGKYEDYLYIDGKLESIKTDTEDMPAFVSKIVLNNVNVAYNLINLQYYSSTNCNIDKIVYQYWLGYRQRYVNVSGDASVSDFEKAILNNADKIMFDGQNVIVSKNIVETIAASVDIPTMMFDYDAEYDGVYDFDSSEFMNTMLKGYAAGGVGIGTPFIHLYWCCGRNGSVDPQLKKISPKFDAYEGKWQIEFQGTSTMKNRIKNFSLRIVTDQNDEGYKLMYSPKFSKSDSTTFLPEVEWTIKADIADSAHANNTCVGKFVNTVCKKFDTGITDSTVKDYIKNTLEGFPVLLFFRCNDDNKIYFFGVYNFNLGRTSYNNLGYNTDIVEMFTTASESTSTDFAFSYAKGTFNNELAIGEVQENSAEFDFSQYNWNLLFGGENPMGSHLRMFGADEKLIGSDLSKTKTKLSNFVQRVSKAGAFCFNEIGKTFKTPYGDGDEYANRYLIKGTVPDPSVQMYYDDTGTRQWGTGDWSVADLSNDALLELIGDQTMDGSANTPLLDYTSASQYYTVCMALGLVDSILKNMNLKSWNSVGKFYCAFYDMDCALGEANDGRENVSYMAATDYWHSDLDDYGYLKEVDVDYDYWDEANGGKGFDFTSSYLIAVIKYAEPIRNYISDISDKLNLSSYPQDFWTYLRGKNGELRNADYFIDTYYKSGVHMIPEYLTSLNYKVKYGYKDEDGTYLVNAAAFNGTRLVKVKKWLTKRLHFLDMMFNVPKLNTAIKEGMPIPSPLTENYANAELNDDVVILTDAFSDDTQNTAMATNTMPIYIWAPKNTPVIIRQGGDYFRYILPAELTSTIGNKIQISSTMSKAERIYGSKEFVKVSNICPLLTSYNRIVSDKLENVIYTVGNTSEQKGGFQIKSVSVKEIKLNIPNYGGTLTLQDSTNKLIGSSITSINIAGSGFIGTFANFENLSYMNISSVSLSSGDISISGNNKLMAENLIISGSSAKSLTTLKSLNIQTVKGDFNITNSAIKELYITAEKDDNGNVASSFSITGDLALTTLSLTDMKSISIVNCPNLETLIIHGSCESLNINMTGYTGNKDYPIQLKTVDGNGNDTTEGVFDFAGSSVFDNLGYLSITGLDTVVTITLPNHEVKVGTFSSCKNLAEIKTTGSSSKLIISDNSTFYDCSSYSLRADKSKNDYYAGIGGTANNGYYTRMGVSSTCTDLSNTFALSSKSNTDVMSIGDARYFISTIVGSEASHIKSLANCFYNRQWIIYDATTAASGGKAPNLSLFTSLKDISQMYNGTTTSIITEELLSLPGGTEYNNSNNALTWDGFATRGTCTVSKNFLTNISYRINSFNDMNITIKEYNGGSEYELITNTEDSPYNILDLFGIRMDDEGNYIPLENITTLSTVNFNKDHYIDFTELFKVLPNVKTISNFLNGDISHFKIDGLLKNCVGMKSITNSFSSSGEENTPIDLYEFFNWGDESNYNMDSLFASYDNDTISFNLNKYISYTNLVELLGNITNYTSLNRLTNIFSNCEVRGYKDQDKPAIVFPDDAVLTNIKCINYLFTNISSDRDDKGLCFTRDLFIQLPNVEKLKMTFSGTRFTDMFTLDFFARRNDEPTESSVYVLTGSDANEDSSYESGYLYTYEYKKNLVDLNNTFYNARFVNCYTWYDIDKDETDVKTKKNYITDSSKNVIESATKYYVCDGRDYYTVSYGSGLTGTVNCTDNIKRVDSSKSFKDIISGNSTFYVKKNGTSYEGYDSTFNRVFTSIPGFATIYSKCETYSKDTTYKVFSIIRYNRGKYTEYTLTTPEIEDNYLNFTHYVKNIQITSMYDSKVYSSAWNNHNLTRDYGLFYTNNGGCIVKGSESNIGESTEIDEYISPNKFVFNYNSYNLYPTHCMLPPDMLYGCYIENLDLDGTFRSLNVMGVIPRHFTKVVSDKVLENLIENVNVLPNVEYYYNTKFAKDDDFLSMIEDVPTVDFEDYDDKDENGNVIASIKFNRNNDSDGDIDTYSVLYRDSDGNLKRRCPNNKDREKAQFVYTPNNYTTGIDIRSAFNFRYNLPPNTVIKGTYRNEAALIEATNSPTSEKPGLDMFYIQYFILMDNSATWSKVVDARNPFIDNSNDIDFSSGDGRSYYIETSSQFENAWTRESILKDASGWYSNVRSRFNCMLNLCGTQNKYTSGADDNGCPVVLNNAVKLDSFLTGNIVTFLNGRVFSEDIAVNLITTAANKNSSSSYVIYLPTITKNIILPVFQNTRNDSTLVFVNGNGDSSHKYEYNLYDFMFNDETLGGTNETYSSPYHYEFGLTDDPDVMYMSIFENVNKYEYPV